jgi:hypothetical protein
VNILAQLKVVGLDICVRPVHCGGLTGCPSIQTRRLFQIPP